MSFKRRQFYRHTEFQGNAAVSVAETFFDRYASCQPDRDLDSPEHSLNWGARLRPHHFQFAEGSRVLLKVEGRRDVLCHAISVLGSGSFLELESSEPVEFLNGAIIVKAGERYKLFVFEEFKKRFVFEDGSRIESIYQIDFQTPKK